jgi:hypothetical protein
MLEFKISTLLSLVSAAPQAGLPSKDRTFDGAIISILNEVKKTNLSLPSSVDSGFPALVAREIQSGNIKVRQPEMMEDPTIAASYNAESNTLSTNRRLGSDPARMSLDEKKILVHELYHSYQDIKALPLRTTSSIEGPAVLVAIRYLLYSEGIRTSNFMAESVLNDTATPDWYMVLSQEKRRQLISYSLTNDPKVWEKGCAEVGLQYVKIGIFFENIAPAVKQYILKQQRGPLTFRTTDKNVTMVLSEKDVVKIALAVSSASLESDEASRERIVGDIVDYWLDEISPAHMDAIRVYDRTPVVMNGTSPVKQK